jgi:hypothetical protein
MVCHSNNSQFKFETEKFAIAVTVAACDTPRAQLWQDTVISEICCASVVERRTGQRSAWLCACDDLDAVFFVSDSQDFHRAAKRELRHILMQRAPDALVEIL